MLKYNCVYVLLNFWAVHLAMKEAFKFSYTETSFVHQTSLNWHGVWQQIYWIYDDEENNQGNMDKKNQGLFIDGGLKRPMWC